MGEPEDKSPAEVVRAKRLEIVDDEGKVRAVLGTDEQGVVSLSIFDASGRLRASLNAEENPEKASGLGVFDTNGKLRAAVGMGNDPGNGPFFSLYDTDGIPRVLLGMDSDPGKGSYLALLDTEGNHRAVVSLAAGGQAGLRFSAGQKDRAIGISAEDEGNLYLMLSAEGIPMAVLGLTEGEDKDLSSELVLVDKDARAGAVISSGPRSDPYVKLMDRRANVRASLELGTNGEPRLNRLDEEGYRSGFGGHLDRVLIERGVVYQAIIVALVLVAGVIAGASMMGWAFGPAGLAQIGSGPFPFGALAAALFIVVIIAILVIALFRQRR
jgi:hypothetical protein